MPCFQNLLLPVSQIPGNRRPPPGYLIEPPMEMPFPKPSFTSLGVPRDGALQIITCLSKSAEKKPPPPSRFPQQGP